MKEVAWAPVYKESALCFLQLVPSGLNTEFRLVPQYINDVNRSFSSLACVSLTISYDFNNFGARAAFATMIICISAACLAAAVLSATFAPK